MLGAQRISLVSYLNTLPFLYGLQHGWEGGYTLSLRQEVPAECVGTLLRGEVDFALVPVAALGELRDVHRITNLCIGASGRVDTVVLLSHGPVQRLRKIYLDPDSRTSAALVQVLCRHHWQVSPAYEALPPHGYELPLHPEEGMLLIGNKVFGQRGFYAYEYDLAAEWRAFTGLPFVFAVWMAGERASKEGGLLLDKALQWGVDRIEEAVESEATRLPIAKEAALEYLTQRIEYRLDEAKLRGLELFQSLIGGLPQPLAPGCSATPFNL